MIIVFYPDGCEVGSECGIVKPTFMILGGQKCGTTSLFHYLLKHPQLLPLGNQSKALGGKETRFFDRPDAAYEKMDKLKYLKDNFMQLKDLRDLNKHSKRLVTGESTPNYLRSPVAPARIKEMFPDMKFIVLLRQPVDRSYSQFNHALRIDGQEQRYTGGNVFETFVRAENMMIYHCNNNHTTAAEYHKCMQTESARAVDALQIPASGPQKNRLVWALQNLERGLYARQLHAFAEAFPDPRQFFIAQSEEFYSQPVKVMEKLQQFLGLEDFDWQQATKGIYNFGQGNGVVRGERGSDYKPLDDRLREEIKRLFQPFNKELFAMFQNNRFPSSLWD